jgi:hypothetical protein
MSKLDTMVVTVLKDGTIKTVTDPISGPNHSSAEEFISGIKKLAGGETEVEKRHDHVHHDHIHQTDYEEQH